jgi:hypothetical protein
MALVVGWVGEEEAPGIFDLRFAIFEQRAKQGSLTIDIGNGSAVALCAMADRVME